MTWWLWKLPKFLSEYCSRRCMHWSCLCVASHFGSKREFDEICEYYDRRFVESPGSCNNEQRILLYVSSLSWRFEPFEDCKTKLVQEWVVVSNAIFSRYSRGSGIESLPWIHCRWPTGLRDQGRFSQFLSKRRFGKSRCVLFPSGGKRLCQTCCEIPHAQVW